MLLLSLVVAGCAPIRPDIRLIPGPDGTVHQSIACGAIEDCYSAAAGSCDGPYKIVDSTSWTSSIAQPPTSPIQNPILVAHHKILVKCGVQ